MKIVIDIPEELYKNIQRKSTAIQIDGDTLENAVLNGTPLPKGHGDLIDRGKLKTHYVGTEQGTDLEVYLEPTIINAPIIIEAHMESEE